MTRPSQQPTPSTWSVEQEMAKTDDWEESVPTAVAEPRVTEEAALTPRDLHPGLASEEAPVGMETDAEEALGTPSPSEDARSKASPQAEEQAVSMKGIEWAGLVVLGVLVAALAIGGYFWSIHLLPQKTPRWQQVSFPVKGEKFEIKNATTYWRAPVVEGPDRDPIRRGTRLIPILELELAGGPAALRVIFRDDEGRSVGDPIIRHFSSSGKLTLAATAGFEDPGMHAAYRTEELDPWSVEVSEAAGVDSPGSTFSQILKMNLSSDLR